MKLKHLVAGLLLASALALGACAGQKDPANKAVAAAESALEPLKAEAAKYLPEELKSAEGALASLKESLGKGDYKAVVAGAAPLMGTIDTLKTQLGAKLEEAKGAAAEWTTYASDLPKMVEAIQSRVSTLSASRKLPKGMDAAGLDAARSGLEAMKTMWTDATAAFSGGNAIDAVAKARTAKAKGEELLKLLGMRSG